MEDLEGYLKFMIIEYVQMSLSLEFEGNRNKITESLEPSLRV